MSLHKFAVIDPKAKIDENVIVGAFATIGPEVEILAGTKIEPYAIINKNTSLGKDNFVSSFVSLGGASQSKHDSHNDSSFLKIGDGNYFHEYCCINRGSIHAAGETKIGNNNIFMSYSHIGHDCIVANNTVLVNQATLAGHVELSDNVIVGYAAAIRQFCKIGNSAFIGEGAKIVKDVLPFTIVRGEPTRVVGINKIGLTRQQIDNDEIEKIQNCFRIVFRKNLTCAEAIAEIIANNYNLERVDMILSMLENSERGLVR